MKKGQLVRNDFSFVNTRITSLLNSFLLDEVSFTESVS